MQLFELMKAIKEKNLPRFLVFTGSEYAISEIYLQHIEKYFKLRRNNITNVSQVVKKQRVISLVGDNNLYICRYDNEFVKKEDEWSNIDAKIGNNYLVLFLSNVDKRGKFYKQFENIVVEFNEQDHNTVVSMVTKQVQLSPENIERLAKGCSDNYSRCLLEIDKIKCLSNVRKISTDKAYETLLRDGTIYEIQESKLQEFTNLVLRKDKKCFKQYNSLIRSGEPNMIIMTWLYNAARNQLAVQTVSKPSQDILGIPYFFIKECLDRVGYYTTNELKNFLSIIKYCEQGIKLGWIEDANSVEYILANVL